MNTILLNGNKSFLRKKYKQVRDKVSFKKEKSELIINKIIKTNSYKEAKVIALYLSFKSEVNLDDLISIALNDNKLVVVPRVLDNTSMVFLKITKNEDYELNKWQIREPKFDETKIVPISRIDLMLIPGICFDEYKNRIGYGLGYYDKYLINSKCTKIGVTYSDCVVKQGIFTIPSDIKMDYVITEKEIY